MPWCPGCKTEYQTGVTMCSDCKIELVDDLDEVSALIPFFQAEDKKVAEKLVKFFNYSDLESSVQYDEENDIYVVLIDPSMQNEAKKLYQAFYFVERERMEKGESDVFSIKIEENDQEDPESKEVTDESDINDTSDESDDKATDDLSLESEDDADKEKDTEETSGDEKDAFDDEDDNSHTYVMKADQYKDLSSTVWIFLIFGIGGLIFVLLNILHVLSIFNGWIPNTVMGALFLFFIYIALSTNKKATKIKSEIDAENKLTKDINNWLKTNVNKEFLASISDEKVSKELNFLSQNDIIKEMLMKEFGAQNMAYLDRLIEEYYVKTFDDTAE